MGQLLLILVVALVVGGIVFGVAVLITGTDRGLGAVEPDGRALPLPTDRPLVEGDVARVRFDTSLRGYRMAQVDQALRRAAYDIGYKDELISVLEAEVVALRAGRVEDAEVLRRAREAALGGATSTTGAAIVAAAAGAAGAAGEAAGSEPDIDLGQVVPAANGAEPADAAALADSAAEPDEPDAEVEFEVEPDAEVEPEVDAEVEPEPEPDDEADAEADAEVGAESDADAEAEVGAEAESGSDAEAGVVDARSGRP